MKYQLEAECEKGDINVEFEADDDKVADEKATKILRPLGRAWYISLTKGKDGEVLFKYIWN